MSKHPPEVYAPGELDKVRQNLGSISIEEAKRVASILGGEVGVEKSPQIARKKYQKAGKMSSSEKTGKTSTDHVPDSGAGNPTEKSDTKPQEKRTHVTRVSYFQRMRKNFLAARKEYRLKTLPDCLLSLFSLFMPVRDNVNPQFILDSRKDIMEPLEDFVLSVRKIYSPKNEELLQVVSKNGFYQKILQTICTWDTENVHKEFSKIRLQAERVHFSDCERMVQSLYRPFIILHHVSAEDHLRKAIEFSLNHHIPLALEESRAGLKNAAEIAFSTLQTVFTSVRQKCYPILLKSLPVRFYEYEDFFRNIPMEAIHHFSLAPGNILNPEELTTSSSAHAGEPATASDTPREETPGEQAALTPETGAAVPENTAEEEQNSRQVVIPVEARKGMEHLDRLFPDTGLLRMEEKPGLYPLLQLLFQPPQGMDLIPPDDPLFQVVFLHRILNELFYGFRSIEYGSFTNAEISPGLIEDMLEPILDSWPYFTSEILEKQYFPRLMELQRLSERNQDFIKSDYGRKIHSDLKWFRRIYLMPYQEVETNAGSRRPSRIQDAPILSETLAQLKLILADITIDMERTIATLREQGVPHSTEFSCTTIHNPWARYKFEIENPVSARLSKLLVKKVRMPDNSLKVKDLRNNANLVSITASIVHLFDYLINSEESYFYKDPPVWLIKQSLPDDTAGSTEQVQS